jgi:hypothetical protein
MASAFISIFQTAQNGTYFGGATRRRNRSGKFIPERREDPAPKNIPGVLQSYVTYDTLVDRGILLTARSGDGNSIWKALR